MRNISLEFRVEGLELYTHIYIAVLNLGKDIPLCAKLFQIKLTKSIFDL